MLTNPASGRNRQALEAILKLVKQYPGTAHHEARNLVEIAQALLSVAAHDPDILVLNAGDGSIAAALTALFTSRSFSRLPLLALVPGGTTNMTAGDVGMKGNWKSALEKLLQWAGAIHDQVDIVQRPVLKVQPRDNQPAQYGMFFGAGAIINGIEYCHRRVLRPGLRDSLGPALCALRVLYAMARGDRKFVSPVPITVSTDPAFSQTTQKHEYFLLLVSALDRLFWGARPYWGGTEGEVYFTAIQAGATRTLSSMPTVLRGRAAPHMTPEQGYWSKKVDTLELGMNSSYTLDGELYKVHDQSGPVRISNGGLATFLRF